MLYGAYRDTGKNMKMAEKLKLVYQPVSVGC